MYSWWWRDFLHGIIEDFNSLSEPEHPICCSSYFGHTTRFEWWYQSFPKLFGRHFFTVYPIVCSPCEYVDGVSFDGVEHFTCQGKDPFLPEACENVTGVGKPQVLEHLF